jgi:hypothetical protein
MLDAVNLDPVDLDSLVAEVATENFADPRLTHRLEKVLRSVGRAPQASLPKILSSADLEAAYRFFSNVFVSPAQILGPHFKSTRERVEAETRVRIVHDTTEFAYRRDGKRRGFSEDVAYQSFVGHFSLAITADSSRKPLGLAALHTWPKGKNTDTEQSFWLKQIKASEEMLGCGTKAVHVCDRGADDYLLLSELVSGDHRFVLRSSVDRMANADGVMQKMRAVLATIEPVEERATWINRRRGESSSHRQKIHPAREPRTIKLNIAAAQLDLLRPATYQTVAKQHLRTRVPETLAINVVRVWEPDPPEGEEPVEWYLFTNEPIDTPAQVAAVVDHYRARWTIEEYFKALKTGCAFEQRQLRDYESLINALALFAPLAYQIVLLRTISRSDPDAPASSVISPDRLDVLRALGRRPLPDVPSARDILLAIAALGGHIKYAPDPGWLTIARGYEKLETLTQGWLAAKLQPHSDQR